MKKILTIIVLGLLLCNKAFSLPKCQGEDVSKWTMCEGIKTTSKGSKYVGEFKDGKYHGQGSFFFPNGGIYKGKWKNKRLWLQSQPLFSVFKNIPFLVSLENL